MSDAPSNKGINRRHWLGLAFLGGAGIVGFSTMAPPLLEDQPHQIIRQILNHKLSDAIISDETYTAFINMFQQTEHYYGLIKAYKVLSALAVFYPSGLLHALPKLRDKLHELEEIVITHFTLSTNFFHDEKVQRGEKPVEFISYWRTRACNNPFATFDPA